MAKPVFGRKISGGQRPRVDRFVMPRDSFTESRRRSWRTGCGIETVHIWHAKHQQRKKYKNHLDEAFGLEPSNCQETRRSEEDVQPWPCVPRRKSYLSSIDSILDLPTYNNATFPELLDWSYGDFLVAALGRHYHMFSWPAQCVVNQGAARHEIQCCKFDPKGELLLVGTDMKSVVEVHDTMWSLWVANGKCVCSTVDLNCSITAVDWSPTSNSFVTGCSRGLVNTFDRTAFLMHSWRNSSRAPIRAVKVSPDARYVALTLVNSSLVHILAWPGLQYHSSMDSNWFVKTITWHPWRSALLAVGALTSKLETAIAFWDTPSNKFKESNLGRTNYILDEMLFSHRSGELVLSLWNLDRSSRFPNSSQLVVMSDPDTVVDRSSDDRGGLDRIRTMVFSPDGTKLATATSDEDLIIWNFLPEDNNKKKTTKSRRFSAIPVYLDHITHGFVLR